MSTSRLTPGSTAAEVWITRGGITQIEGVQEGQGVVRHRGDGARRGSRRPGDAGIVEEDHFAKGGERVHEGGVPVVEVAAEVLQQHKRCYAR